MDWDPGIALNLADVPSLHKRPKQIDFTNKLQVKSFFKKFMEIIPKEQMQQELESLEQASNSSQTRQHTPGNLSMRITLIKQNPSRWISLSSGAG